MLNTLVDFVIDLVNICQIVRLVISYSEFAGGSADLNNGV